MLKIFRPDLKFFVLLLFVSCLLFSDSASADFLNQMLIFNINQEYEYLGRSQVGATLRKISDKAYWYISDEYWAGISEADRDLFLQKVDELALEFDNRIYPIETQFWGAEPNPGIDGDPKITVLVTHLIDLAGGYFDTTHFFTRNQVSESNEREMVFINSLTLAGGRTKIFLAHEFQHLIGFQQKDVLRNATEDIWLNEARAEYAPRELGYDDVYDISNIRRRVFAFQQNPSEPLGEWKNQSSDYGAISTFMYYLVDNYGDKILLDTLRSSETGIDSFNEFLFFNGFTERFSDVFSNWTIANVLNDSSVDSKFSYKSANLNNFRISPTQSYSISGAGTAISISNTVKDWQPVWYEFNTPVNSGSGLNLKIEFSAQGEGSREAGIASDSGTNFKVPYIAFKINGQKEVGFVPVVSSAGTLFLKNFGSDVYKIVLIPANHSKISDFTKDDPAVSFTLKVQLTTEFQEVAPMPTPTSQLSAEALIQSLLDQIAVLQNQIGQLSKGTKSQSPPISSNILNRDLYIGLQGEDVRWLQEFLIGENVYPEARITGYFGVLTKNAVIGFQEKYGIFPQIGYVGIKTRNKINELAE